MSTFPVPTAVQNANHHNAQLSTGPRTEEGKARSSQNSLVHGAYSQSVLLPGDDLAQYEALGRQLMQDCNATTAPELSLHTEIQESTWRLNRIVFIERSTLFLKTELNMDVVKTRFADRVSDPAILRQLAQAEAYASNAWLFGQPHREEKRLRTLVNEKRGQLQDLVQLRERSQTRTAPVATPISTDPVRSVPAPYIDNSSKEHKRQLIANMTKPKQYR